MHYEHYHWNFDKSHPSPEIWPKRSVLSGELTSFDLAWITDRDEFLGKRINRASYFVYFSGLVDNYHIIIHIVRDNVYIM